MAARMRLVLKTCVLTAFAVLAAAQTVDASLIAIKISDGTTTKTCSTTKLGILDTGTGSILLFGALGVWNLNNVTGVGENVLGIPGSMDLHSINISNAGTTGTLTDLVHHVRHRHGVPGLQSRVRRDINECQGRLLGALFERQRSCSQARPLPRLAPTRTARLAVRRVVPQPLTGHTL